MTRHVGERERAGKSTHPAHFDENMGILPAIIAWQRRGNYVTHDSVLGPTIKVVLFSPARLRALPQACRNVAE